MHLDTRPSRTRPVLTIAVTMAVFMALGLLSFALFYPQTALYRTNAALGVFIYVAGLTVLGNAVFLFMRLSGAMVIGWRNESRIMKYLKELPDSYTAFTNLTLPGETPSRLDIVLVGPKGVLFFVVKHYTGTIIHNGKEWTRIRPNRREQKLRSLSSQLQAAEKAFFQILKARGISVPLKGMLLFAHPKVALQVSKASVPLLRPENFIENITALPDRVSEEAASRAVEAIRKMGS